MEPVYRKVTVSLTPWQWKVVKASAKCCGIPAKEFEAHAECLLHDALSMAAEEIANETTVTVPQLVLDCDVRTSSPAIATRLKEELAFE